jgi:hypothetical protein
MAPVAQAPIVARTVEKIPKMAIGRFGVQKYKKSFRRVVLLMCTMKVRH